MSRFRQQPRIGHLERLKKIVGYLANFPHGALTFRLHEPDYSNLPHKEYDWQRTVYEGAKEEIPHDIPEPKRKYVTTTTYVDAISECQNLEIQQSNIYPLIHWFHHP